MSGETAVTGRDATGTPATTGGQRATGGQWRISVHKSCRRSGICAAAAPRYFSVGEDHRTRPAAEPVDPDPELIEVVEACPAEAITLTDLATGRPVEAAREAAAEGATREARP
ncbi:ferredoxin [Streptomyces roseicoloratus]|uniref:ferredoxin n=1 Tax=Streptomyces roseicoloratus TaxID=2508722 RepID=UPI001009F6BB|nr:ferredoxin [Streptomyces roseicoloratus]